ncbi:unnamed protein product (macronuclear) [Paramecium tetraurelia]|uniref:Kelch motif family protein n=1 Tax=Paramecium tetraurelia TaxID=5888 RepID=A0EG20_PARTE|nr:uncharacterized protein GSPATT00026584001 [Paramecium tetraurelia]CAK94261.1 unnamed protein product [Paramecium tetraurelia]|eukprot:XP_001461634.1 hypothetical protein (macronuclear) [Paramecium tetraurelia strain d4-2]
MGTVNIELIHFEKSVSLNQSTFFKTFSEMQQKAAITHQVARIPSPKERLQASLSHNKKQRETIINQSRERLEIAMSEALTLTQKSRNRNYQKLKRRDQNNKKAVELKPQQKVFQLPQLDTPLENSVDGPAQLSFYFESQRLIRDIKTFKPSFTEQAAFTLFNDQLYLYGGIGGDGVRNQMLKYDIKFQIWQVVHGNGENLKQGRAGLSVVQYKNKFIYFGGCGQFNPKLKIRECSNQVFEFTVSNQSWEKLHPQGDYVEPRRQHRACLIGSKWMLIHGGINSNEEVLSDTSIFNIEKQYWKNYKAKSPPICCHGIVNISSQGKFQEMIPNDLMPQELIFSFGGKDAEGNSVNAIRKLTYCSFTNIPLSWDLVECTGKAPPPMHNHTVEYLRKVQGIAVIGGLRDFIQNGTLESDQYYIFYPHLSLWQEVIAEGQRIPRCAHSSVMLSSKIAVFGGIGNERYLEPDVGFIETDQIQVFTRVAKEKVLNNTNQNFEEPSRQENSFRKKKSLFQDESEISDGYKPFRITLRKTTQARRSYLPNPHRKQVFIRYDILMGFVKQIINENLHILQNFDKYLERKIL